MKPRVLLLPVALLAACESPDVDDGVLFGGPAGALEGTVTYAGPPPCTEGGKVIGAVVLLAFDNRLLPPPEGLGVSAASLDVIPGELLFGGIRDKLTFVSDGARFCPDASSPPITVSATWAMAPLPSATYQVRGFYDRDGDFDPAFKISNLPTKGDVGGGAIDNAAEVLAGAPPKYREMKLDVGAEGAKVSGIAVTLGLSLPLERPVFYAKEVLDESGRNTDPARVTMPSDYQLPVFSASDPGATEKSFIRYRFGAGVLPDETATAAASPFLFPVGDPPAKLVYSRQDVNGDGIIDAADHVPDSALLPSLFPLAVFAKLEDGQPLVSQARPVVILQGLTLYKSLSSTAFAPVDLNDASDEVLVGLRPAALCLDPADAQKPGVLVTSHATDAAGNPLIADEAEVKANLSAQFHRPIEIAYACLPEGQYAANLVYGTGQAWTIPNEAGVCAPSEPSENGGATCGKRARLASQDAMLIIGPPDDPAYCAANPPPAACRP